MSGVQKSQLSKVNAAGVRSVQVPITVAATPVTVLADPAAGFVRRVFRWKVQNLDDSVHTFVPANGTHKYDQGNTVVAVGASDYFGAILLNPGEALTVEMGTSLGTGSPPVATLIYQDFPIASGMGGGKLSITAAASTVLIAGPTSGVRVIGRYLEGVPDLVPFAPRFVERTGAGGPFFIELTVAGQVVEVIPLPLTGTVQMENLVVLLPGQSLSTRILSTPPWSPPAVVSVVTIDIDGAFYWQDSI